MKTDRLIFISSSLVNNRKVLGVQRPKAVLLAFVFLLLSLLFKSQVNYVPNPSFEQVKVCGTNSFITNTLIWDTLHGGGGGGNSLSNCPGLPPVMPQTPRTGFAYSALNMYSPWPVTWRSYIQAKLVRALTSNKSYCVTFYTMLQSKCQYAIDEIGVYIDDGSIGAPCLGCAAIATVQVKSPTGVFIKDTLNWKMVQGFYLANGTEDYISLGNFKPQANITASLVYPNNNYACGYIFDDVSIIEADLPAFAGRDTVICTGDSIFIGRPPEIGLECLWTSGTNTVGTGGGLWVKPAGTQTFMVSQNVCGVINTDTIKVQVKPKYTGANINLVSSSPTTCPTNTVILNVTNNPPGTNAYDWLPSGVYTHTANTTASAVVSQNTTLSLNVSNNGQNAFCPFQQTASVSVSVPAYTDSPSLSYQSIICPEDTVFFNVQNAAPGNIVSYQWLPSAAFTNTSNLSAKSVISQNTNFTVNVTSSGNASLCAFTRTLNASVNVPDSCLHDPVIPNIFTPNGDNVNDVWEIKFPRGASLQELIVYDRWGTLIYERDNLNFDLQAYARIGWDGYTTSGNQCTAGVYFYILKYTDPKGTVKGIKGNVTLMK